MLDTAKAMTSFSVDDVPGAQRFYGETLGLDVSEESGALLLHLADGHDTLVYRKQDHIPATYTVLNFAVDDIDVTVDGLVDRGVRLLRFDRYGADDKGIVRGEDRDIAWFSDPAGNIHSVFTPKAPLGR